MTCNEQTIRDLTVNKGSFKLHVCTHTVNRNWVKWMLWWAHQRHVTGQNTHATESAPGKQAGNTSVEMAGLGHPDSVKMASVLYCLEKPIFEPQEF